ncbi:MAG: ribosome recycling factor [Gammaproteobacteria bacterium]|nr:ribosome recycling factor [Gammaproteobacteria bacterium]
MIDEIQADADDRMGKSIEALHSSFGRLRTGRANPSLLDGIEVSYYGTDTPLNQVASITVEDARTLAISPWEKNLIPDIEKAILKSDLGITPSSNKELIRVPLPALTEENRKDLARVAKQEAESARVAIRNIRRDAIHEVRELAKAKEVAEDEARKAEEKIQSITDRRIGEVESTLGAKEADLMEI